MGPTLLDRTDQFNFGGLHGICRRFPARGDGHVWSPLAITPLLNLSAGPGVIFQSDFTGDGT